MTTRVQDGSENDPQTEQPVNKSKNQAHEYLLAESIGIVIGLFILAVIYLGVCIVYLNVVHKKFHFREHYPKILTEHPGSLRDERFSFFWFCLLFTLLHMLIPIFLLLVSTKMGSSLSIDFLTVLIFLNFALDIVCILSAFFFWVLCNNPYIPLNPCNDGRYCKVYVEDTCSDGSYTGLTSDTLKPNIDFVNYRWFAFIFAGLDFIVLLLLPSIYQLNERMFKLVSIR